MYQNILTIADPLQLLLPDLPMTHYRPPCRASSPDMGPGGHALPENEYQGPEELTPDSSARRNAHHKKTVHDFNIPI
jgi:hypothetical protein